ncbi:MAG: hypothetical protein ACLQVL_26900 [Terriglobia bacterium]
MGEKEIAIISDELVRLEIHCRNCGSAISFDMSRDIPQLAGEESVAKQCPVCKSLFPDKTQHALMLYNNFQTEVKKSKLDVRFRVKSL